jgi:hypothetical protein
MIFPKFIIQRDQNDMLYLKFGKVEFHHELKDPDGEVISGGWWRLNPDMSMAFFSKSTEYGKFKLEDVQKCIDNDMVYSAIPRSLASNFDFYCITEELSGQSHNLKNPHRKKK